MIQSLDCLLLTYYDSLYHTDFSRIDIALLFFVSFFFDLFYFSSYALLLLTNILPMKNLICLLSILGLSLFTLPIDAQEGVQKEDVIEDASDVDKQIEQAAMSITWIRFAMRETAHYLISVLSVLFIVYSDKDFDIYVYGGWMGLELLYIANVILYARKLPWTQGISYRYSSDIVIQCIVSFIVKWANVFIKDKPFDLNEFLEGGLMFIIVAWISRSIVDLFDHFAV